MKNIGTTRKGEWGEESNCEVSQKMAKRPGETGLKEEDFRGT